jgi:hypothetical protein
MRLLSFVAVVLAVGCGSSPLPESESSAAAVRAPDGKETPTGCGFEVEVFDQQERRHLKPDVPTDFDTVPATGGNHYAIWGAWGPYREPVNPGHYVHNLEHGGVGIFYKAGADPGLEAALMLAVKEAGQDPGCPEGTARVIVAPEPTLTSTFALVAWGKRYPSDALDIPAFACFIAAYRGQSFENTCAHGQALKGFAGGQFDEAAVMRP